MSKQKPGTILFQGLEAGMRLFRWVVLILVILFWLSGIQNVQPTNVGLLTRFGKLLPHSLHSPTIEPGLVLALPYPIDQLVQIPKGQEQLVEVSDVWAALDLPDKANRKIDPIYEGYCLTGDNNIVQTKFVVKYMVTDPVVYHFEVSDPTTFVRDLVMASLTETIAGWNVNEVLQLQRVRAQDATRTEKLDTSVLRRAQARLDALRCGITLSGLEFVAMHYPRHVNGDFENVQTTRIANETRKRRAEEYARKKNIEAESFRTSEVNRATAEAYRLVSEAKVEKEGFTQLCQEFRQAPQQVWQRMYTESMEQVWKNVGRLDFVPPNSRVLLTDEPKQEAQP